MMSWNSSWPELSWLATPLGTQLPNSGFVIMRTYEEVPSRHLRQGCGGWGPFSAVGAAVQVQAARRPCRQAARLPTAKHQPSNSQVVELQLPNLEHLQQQ